MAIKRRTFLGAATLGTGAAVVPVAASSQYGSDYEVVVRPAAVVGLGRGDAASLSVVWMPGKSAQVRPLKVRLVLYDLSGKELADKATQLTPFSGAAIDYQRPAANKRQQVFGYVFVDGLTTKLASELFGGIEVYDVSSGRMNIAAGAVGLG